MVKKMQQEKHEKYITYIIQNLNFLHAHTHDTMGKDKSYMFHPGSDDYSSLSCF